MVTVCFSCLFFLTNCILEDVTASHPSLSPGDPARGKVNKKFLRNGKSTVAESMNTDLCRNNFFCWTATTLEELNEIRGSKWM